jgi:hypothetical protein
LAAGRVAGQACGAPKRGLIVTRFDGTASNIIPFPRTVIHPQFHPLEPEWIERGALAALVPGYIETVVVLVDDPRQVMRQVRAGRVVLLVIQVGPHRVVAGSSQVNRIGDGREVALLVREGEHVASRIGHRGNPTRRICAEAERRQCRRLGHAAEPPVRVVGQNVSKASSIGNRGEATIHVIRLDIVIILRSEARAPATAPRPGART